MKAEHTPGPWIGIGPNRDLCIAQYRDGGGELTRICTLNQSIEQPERMANAQLIVAAPDLLEACRDAVWLIENSSTLEWNAGNEAAARSRLKAAIAKASGKGGV